MPAVAALLASRKFLVALIGSIVSSLLYAAGQADAAKTVGMLSGGYILGQGMADWGKEAKKP